MVGGVWHRHDMKAPRRVVTIEIRQGAAPVTREETQRFYLKPDLPTISSALVMSECESKHIRKS